MGQQQLLLIVLSVIIVGISVAIGITMFTESAASANLDAVTNDNLRIASAAQQWYMKPTSMGGGGRDFTGVSFTNIGVRASNDNGVYTISGVQAGQFTLTGVGHEDGDGDGTNCTAVTTVFPDAIFTQVTNRE